jgi:hypothetical protein
VKITKPRSAKTARNAVQVNVKLRSKADASGTVKLLSALPGVKKIEQTLPGESDPELSRLYILKLDPSKADSAMQQIQKHTGVEYVEGAAPRKLIW